MTVTITEFITARLDEDETAAQTCPPWPWTPDADHLEVLSADGIPVCEAFALSGNQLRAAVTHVARHDPARVLREVTAKRAILDLHQPEQLTARLICDECSDGYEIMEWAPDYPCDTVRAIALAYTDHPDFDPKWSTT